MRIHSTSPLIANSSTSIVAIANSTTITTVNSILETIMKAFGIIGAVEDYFEVSLEPNDYFFELMADEFQSDPRYEELMQDYTSYEIDNLPEFEAYWKARMEQEIEGGSDDDGSPYFFLVVKPKAQNKELADSPQYSDFAGLFYNVFAYEEIAS